MTYHEFGLFISCGPKAPNWCYGHHKFSGYAISGDAWFLSMWPGCCKS